MNYILVTFDNSDPAWNDRLGFHADSRPIILKAPDLRLSGTRAQELSKVDMLIWVKKKNAVVYMFDPKTKKWMPDPEWI